MDLLEELRFYGRHKGTCPGSPCHCGLTTTLRRGEVVCRHQETTVTIAAQCPEGLLVGTSMASAYVAVVAWCPSCGALGTAAPNEPLVWQPRSSDLRAEEARAAAAAASGEHRAGDVEARAEALRAEIVAAIERDPNMLRSPPGGELRAAVTVLIRHVAALEERVSSQRPLVGVDR